MTAMMRAGLKGPAPRVEGLGPPRPGGYGSGDLLVTPGARIPEPPASPYTAVPSPIEQLNTVYNRDQLWTEFFGLPENSWEDLVSRLRIVRTEGFSRQGDTFDETAAEKCSSGPS